MLGGETQPVIQICVIENDMAMQVVFIIVNSYHILIIAFEIPHRAARTSSNLIQTVYEDKVIGKIPEEVCISLLEKYQAEKKSLQAECAEYKKRSEMQQQDEKDVEEFIARLKSYAGATELTRQMCLDLIEYVTVDDLNKDDKSRPREIHIYYKLIDKELADKHNALM